MNFIMSIPMSSSSLSDQITPSLSQSRCFWGGSRGKTKSQCCPYIQSRSAFYGIRNARAASSAPASSTHGKRTYRIETHANKIAIMFGWNQPTPGTDKSNMILIILEHVQHCGVFTLALDKGVQQRFIGSSI